jgi:hypothetical protein
MKEPGLPDCSAGNDVAAIERWPWLTPLEEHPVEQIRPVYVKPAGELARYRVVTCRPQPVRG